MTSQDRVRRKLWAQEALAEIALLRARLAVVTARLPVSSPRVSLRRPGTRRTTARRLERPNASSHPSSAR